MITIEELNHYFIYKDNDLYWKNAPLKRTDLIGKLAGTPNELGYRQLQVKGNRLKVHRVIYMLKHGIVDGEIDHIDGNTTNNSIDNLRLANRSQNCQNTKKRIDNKSGVKGLFFDKTRNKWRIEIQSFKKRITERFNDFDDAVSRLNEIRLEKHGSFANKGVQ